MIYAAILAAGSGSRMGNTDVPKQFLPLGDMPVIAHCIKTFLEVSEIDKLYIGAAQVYLSLTRSIIEQYFSNDKDRIRIIAGDSERNKTLIKIIEAITEENGMGQEDILLTHDGVRPFVSKKIIYDNIITAASYGACTTAIPSKDTVLVSKDGAAVNSVPDRKEMFCAQTPQSFKLKMFTECMNSLSENDKMLLTDSCKICVLCGQKVCIVNGSDENFKITTRSDYEAALHIAEKKKK